MKFQAGQSGNAEGRRVETSEEFKTIRDICRLRSVVMVDILSGIAEDKEERGMTRIAAANSILDRAWGKPKQEIDISPEKKPDIDLSWLNEEMVMNIMLAKQGKGRFVPNEPENDKQDD